MVSLLADHSSVAFRVVEGASTADPATITPATFFMESFSAESVVDPSLLTSIELQRKYDRMLKLAVNVEDAQGIDVKELVKTLHNQTERIANLEEDLAQSRTDLQFVRVRLSPMHRLFY